MRINNNSNTGNTNFKAGVNTNMLFEYNAGKKVVEICKNIIGTEKDIINIHLNDERFYPTVEFTHFAYSPDLKKLFPFAIPYKEKAILPMRDKLSSGRLEGENFDRIFIDDDSKLGEASILNKILEPLQRLADSISKSYAARNEK